jgi:hypothetical protein
MQSEIVPSHKLLLKKIVGQAVNTKSSPLSFCQVIHKYENLEILNFPYARSSSLWGCVWFCDYPSARLGAR